MRIARPRLADLVRGALATGSVVITAGAGCGKTTVLEQATGALDAPVAWIACRPTDRTAGRFLMRILNAMAHASPGTSDALAERLLAAPEQIDALEAGRELLAQLSRLLLEPLVVVIDDAEHLDGAQEALELLGLMLGAERTPLRLAVATRVQLDVRTAKARARGQLIELNAAELAFGPAECAALLRERFGSEPAPQDVDRLVEMTEGWALGIGVAAARVGREGVTNRRGASGLSSAPELRDYLIEEVLDRLEPRFRDAVIDSSVAVAVTPAVERAVGLPAGFAQRLESAGLLGRALGDGRFAFHPLLRELLLDRVSELRSSEERTRLHEAAARAAGEDGDPVAAIEHWLEAESWEEAAAAIERNGQPILRTSPDLARRWLASLPAAVRERPTLAVIEGQLEWGAGEHPRAIELLERAVAGFRDQPNPPVEWLARFVLLDSLFAVGRFEEAPDLVEGWDDPANAAAGMLAPAAATYAGVLLGSVGRIQDSHRLVANVYEHPDAALLRPLDAIRLAFCETPEGRLDEVLARTEAAARELARFDPFNRRLYTVASAAMMYADRGDLDEAIRLWLEVREQARAGDAPFLRDTSHAWCALYLAKAGRLREAETELAQHQRQERSWRNHIGDLAAAVVASLRGDRVGTVTSAERARRQAARAPILFRYWTAADLVPALARVGRSDLAFAVLDETQAGIDAVFPERSGDFPRGRLLALRAWLEHQAGDAEAADRDLVAFWAGPECSRHTLRLEWERLRPVIWAGLERGALEPETAMERMVAAFPDCLELVSFLDHPAPAVRQAAIEPSVRSGDPGALERLRRLADDPDPELAAAATRSVAEAARTLPPLRFEILGGFTVGRGSWRAGDKDWRRPIDARLVRFLLVHAGSRVPEGSIFEALWPGRPEAAARRSAQVAVSAARRVLDPPGAADSVIEGGGRAYRLVLGERDAIDAEEFRAAAQAGLAAEGEERAALLERARALWGGEPLPEDRYADWASAYREDLVERYIATLSGLVELRAAAGEHLEAAALARELVDLDPLNEAAQRALITEYARAGRTGHALRQYLECRRTLVEELGIEPAEETTRLQTMILAGETP